jgi:hypothetical protein
VRDYGKVFCALWGSRDFRSLTEDGRALVQYLLTSPHGTMIGVFNLPDGYVCEDIQWPSERVSEGFTELFRKGFATRCPSTSWVWIRKYLEWNEPDNPNQWKAARKLAAKVPQTCSWATEFHEYFGLIAEQSEAEKALAKGNRSRTVSKPGTGTGSGTGVGTGSVTGTGTGGAHTSDASDSAPGGEQRAGDDVSGQSTSLEDPQTRRGDAAARRNGDFEAVNEAVSKLLASGVCSAEQPDLLAKLAHISPRQAREALRQLRDRGRLPTGVAA